jgi:serine/threonine protein kinase
LDLRLSDFGNAAYVPEASETLENVSPSSTLSPTSTIEPGTPSYQNSQSLKDGLAKGTLAYTAPELLKNQAYTFTVDIYSLGITYYCLLTGVNPFSSAKTNIQLMLGIKKGFFSSHMQQDWNERFLTGEKVDERIIQLIHKMVSLEPTNRPFAKQVLQILEEIDA